MLRYDYGEFQTDGELVICDPVYGPNDAYVVRVECVPGAWTAYVDFESDDDVEKPCAISSACCDFDEDFDECAWADVGVAGVDSGQMCIWDAHDHSNDDQRIDDIAYGYGSGAGGGTLAKSGQERFYLGDRGLASSTFYGDGAYQVLAVEGDDGRAVAVRVEFI